MTMYEAMYEKIQKRYESGEITLETAERLNELAYDKYVEEKGDKSADEEMAENFLQKVQDGKKIPKKLKEELKDFLDDDDSNDSDDSDSNDDSDNNDDDNSSEEE